MKEKKSNRKPNVYDVIAFEKSIRTRRIFHNHMLVGIIRINA